MTKGWLDRIDALQRPTKAFLIVVLFVAIVATDAATGLDLSLRALYLVPVAATAWFIGRRSAFVVAVASVCATTYFDATLGLGRTHPRFVYGDAIVRLGVFVAAVTALVALRDAQARLADLAQTDPLTGLYNRRGLEDVARREIARARRSSTSLTLAHLDLDGFKALNDRLGHGEGDAVLAAVGEALKTSRAIDVAARVGGDEFVLLLPDTESAPGLRAVERIIGGLNDAMSARRWNVTFSVGVATFRSPDDLVHMIAVADALMYEAKQAGKGCIRHRGDT